MLSRCLVCGWTKGLHDRDEKIVDFIKKARCVHGWIYKIVACNSKTKRYMKVFNKMLSPKQRKLYFLLGCIPVRLLLVLLAYRLPEKYLPILGVILLIPAIGFIYLYFANKRLNAPESGGKTWWASLRLIHGALYLIASIYALQKKRYVWIPLLIDAFVGLTAFTVQHSKNL